VTSRRSIEDQLAARATRAVCRRRFPHLLFATYFLSPAKRDATRALAAFLCISYDALASGATNPTGCTSTGSSVAPLLIERIDRLYNNQLHLPLPEFRDESQHILHAMGQTLRQFDIPREYLLTWTDGVLADQSITRYATWNALERHCHQTHGQLALAAAAILGVTRSDAPPLLLNLASGIRLIEILTHLKGDLSANKVYLPLADLAQHRYSERELLSHTINDNFRQFIGSEVARARSLLDNGQTLIPWFGGDGSRVAAAALVTQYRDLLGQVERRDFDPFTDSPPSPASSLCRLPAIWRLARQQPAAIASTTG
jgi:phytoene/squalene synthetase